MEPDADVVKGFEAAAKIGPMRRQGRWQGQNFLYAEGGKASGHKISPHPLHKSATHDRVTAAAWQ
jgi:hypothetical protein